MATLACHKPVIDYFSLLEKQPENLTFTPSLLDWDGSLYTDPLLLNSPSSDSINTSLGSPNSIPYSDGKYDWSSEESDPDEKPALLFPPREFDDWLSGWDDTMDGVLSPPVELPLSDMDTVELRATPPLSPRTSIDVATISNQLSDRSMGLEDPGADEPLFQEPQIFSEKPDITLRKDLIPSPTSWDHLPQPSYRASSPSSYGTLSTAEEARLRSIAMPAQHYPDSPLSSISTKLKHTDGRRKRKSPKSSEVDRSPPPRSRHQAPRKTAHNMIEKRYRTNINEKIATLRDSIPSLRVMVKNNSGSEDLEDLQGLSPAQNLNKATILSKAIEYIAHLEKRNEYLTKQNTALATRINAFEALLMAQSCRKSAAHLVASGYPASRGR